MLFPPTIPSSYLHRFTIHLAVQLTISCWSTVIPFILFCFPPSLSLSLSLSLPSHVEKVSIHWANVYFRQRTHASDNKTVQSRPLIGDRRTWRMSYETGSRDMAVRESSAQAGGRPEPPTTAHWSTKSFLVPPFVEKLGHAPGFRALCYVRPR